MASPAFEKWITTMFSEQDVHISSKAEYSGMILIFWWNIQVSLNQLVVLLLFNNFTEYFVQRIQEETQIQLDTLLQILNVLFGSKILTLKKSTD